MRTFENIVFLVIFLPCIYFEKTYEQQCHFSFSGVALTWQPWIFGTQALDTEKFTSICGGELYQGPGIMPNSSAQNSVTV
jgi:hypothetical protein